MVIGPGAWGTTAGIYTPGNQTSKLDDTSELDDRSFASDGGQSVVASVTQKQLLTVFLKTHLTNKKAKGASMIAHDLLVMQQGTVASGHCDDILTHCSGYNFRQGLAKSNLI